MSATSEDLCFILEVASRAPSHHNLQPWRARCTSSTLELSIDPARVRHALGGEGAALLALGGFAENAMVAARARGFDATLTLPEANDDDGPVAVVTLRRTEAPVPKEALRALEAARARATNRRPAGDAPPPPAALERLRIAAASAGGFSLLPVLDEEERDVLAALLGEGAALISFQRAIRDEATAFTRFTREEAERTRDGLDIDTFEPSEEQRAFLTRTKDFDAFTAATTRDAVAEGARRQLAQSPCLGVLVAPAPPTSRARAFEAGRALVRTWNAAAAEGLALHPSGAVFLFTLEPDGLERSVPAPDDRQLVEDILDDVRTLLDIEGDARPYFAFRLFTAEAPSTRSLRRPVEAFATLVSAP